MSDYTKKLIKKRNLFCFLQLFVMFAVAITYMVLAVRGKAYSGDLKSKIGTIAYSMGVTLIILTALLCIVGHKIRSTIWMVNTILGAYLFGTTGMYITFAIWTFDEYVLFNLYESYKNKVTINKEIDKRGD